MKQTILKRLVTGNMIMLSFVVFFGALVVFQLDKLHTLSISIVDVDTKGERICESLSTSIREMLTFEKKYIISKDKDYFKRYLQLKSVFEEETAFLVELLRTPELQAQAANMVNLFKLYTTSFINETQDLDNLPNKDTDPDPSRNREQLVVQIENKLRHIIFSINEDKTSKILLSNHMINGFIKLTIGITGFAFLLGLLISIVNTRVITRSISLLKQQTGEIAKGRFNQIEPLSSTPKEIKDLTNHFNVMCTRLKELEVMKADFISHFSHELRTPVTSIKEASSMLDMQLFQSDPIKQKELSQLIISECDRLILSIEQILDLSRMEVFKMEYTFSKANIIDVIKNALEKFVPSLENKNIDLQVIFDKDIPECNMDVIRIEEVINNLVSNALRYTPEDGSIEVSISVLEKKRKVQVSVSDNGCGIDKKNLEAIFEKFKRIDRGDQTLRGSGLGLAISKHIIKAHKGKIWAESENFKGTKIFFVLPVA